MMFLNVKTAEKSLQFGPTKCKSMLVGKPSQFVLNSDLHVDSWKVSYQDNIQTGELDLIETFDGQVLKEKTTSQKYVGFVLSSTGDNMINIRHMKNKSIGIIRQILTKLESLHLQKYYFECAIIFMNSMLRSSILYAAETYYNLKEQELREIERIEEGFLRKLMKTSKNCPIAQLYLSLGIMPARFQIMKMRLMFLKDIMDEKENSLVRQFYELQLRKPIKGDWASTCAENLEELKIRLSNNEIRNMKRNQFKNILNMKINELGFRYLLKKRGKKGQEVEHFTLRMADYLAPNNSGMTIEEKQQLFAIINRMVNISYNFPQNKTVDLCYCGELETMEHIYHCKLLNKEDPIISYNQIFNGNIGEQVTILRRFETNMKKREQMKIQRKECRTKENLHVIQNCDPQYNSFVL